MFRNLSNAAIHRRGIANYEMQSHNTGDLTMSINILSESNFDSIVGTKPALIDFGAEWCVYCKKIAPIIEEIAAEKTDLVFGYIDVDLQPMLAARFRVHSLPTVLLLKDGQVVKQFLGAQSKETFLNAIDAL